MTAEKNSIVLEKYFYGEGCSMVDTPEYENTTSHSFKSVEDALQFIKKYVDNNGYHFAAFDFEDAKKKLIDNANVKRETKRRKIDTQSYKTVDEPNLEDCIDNNKIAIYTSTGHNNNQLICSVTFFIYCRK